MRAAASSVYVCLSQEWTQNSFREFGSKINESRKQIIEIFHLTLQHFNFLAA